MSWTDALRPWHGSTAKKVALYMYSNWGWNATVSQGRLHCIRIGGSARWEYSEALKDDLDEQVQQLIDALDVTMGMSLALDDAVKEIGSVGKHTILPFPKDITPQRAAPASHFQ